MVIDLLQTVNPLAVNPLTHPLKPPVKLISDLWRRPVPPPGCGVCMICCWRGRKAWRSWGWAPAWSCAPFRLCPHGCWRGWTPPPGRWTSCWSSWPGHYAGALPLPPGFLFHPLEGMEERGMRREGWGGEDERRLRRGGKWGCHYQSPKTHNTPFLSRRPYLFLARPHFPASPHPQCAEALFALKNSDNIHVKTKPSLSIQLNRFTVL